MTPYRVNRVLLTTERWYWLLAFCVVSAGIHAALSYRFRAFYFDVPVPPPATIDITLEPLPQPPSPATPAPRPVEQPAPVIMPRVALAPMPVRTTRPMPPPLPHAETPPEQSAPNREEGMTAEPVRVAANPRIRPDASIPSRPLAAPTATIRPRAAALPGGTNPLAAEKPMAMGLPTGKPYAGAPKIRRTAMLNPLIAGGGAPSPGPVLGGAGGAKGPDLPPEDVMFSGQGAGGDKLPRAAPRIGGGGGQPILSVHNPLSKEAVPEERPGIGPGVGGGQGAGAGGGAGYGRGAGIGTRPGGKYDLASLQAKPGLGIGAAQGTGIGTHSPRGGGGVGSELPGVGLGPGRGSGSGAGVGDGVGGPGKTPGVALGSISGILGGSPQGGGGVGGGPGGPGRGGLFGVRPGGGGGGPSVHVVYVLDTSGSMRDGSKLAKAQQALKMALAELSPNDTFDIISFYAVVQQFAPVMAPATPANISRAMLWVDSVAIGDGTNLSGALSAALALRGVTNVFVLSDGDPTDGITDPTALCQAVSKLNAEHAAIQSLALGLGEHFKGMDLLRALAEDNHGSFAYIDLTK